MLRLITTLTIAVLLAACSGKPETHERKLERLCMVHRLDLQNRVKNALAHPLSAKINDHFEVSDASANYVIYSGTVRAKNSFGVEDELPFRMLLQVDTATDDVRIEMESVGK